MVNLKINPEFQNLIQPLSENEFRQLEQNIISQGCRDVIFAWKDVIVDGHNRYAICTRNDIPFKVKNLRFAAKKDAVLWILENQLGRRNLSDAMRIELALQIAELINNRPKDGGVNKRKSIAENAKVSEQTVYKYLQIKESADPKLLARLKKGEAKISTEHKALVMTTTTVKKLSSDADLKRFNSTHRHSRIIAVKNNIAVIEKLYRLMSDIAAADESENDLGIIRKRLSAQIGVSGKVCKKNAGF